MELRAAFGTVASEAEVRGKLQQQCPKIFHRMGKSILLLVWMTGVPIPPLHIHVHAEWQSLQGSNQTITRTSNVFFFFVLGVNIQESTYCRLHGPPLPNPTRLCWCEVMIFACMIGGGGVTSTSSTKRPPVPSITKRIWLVVFLSAMPHSRELFPL